METKQARYNKLAEQVKKLSVEIEKLSQEIQALEVLDNEWGGYL